MCGRSADAAVQMLTLRHKTMRVNSSANPETAALAGIIKNCGGFLPLINPLKAVSNMPSPLMIGLLVFVVILAGAFVGRTVGGFCRGMT